LAAISSLCNLGRGVLEIIENDLIWPKFEPKALMTNDWPATAMVWATP